MNLPEVMEIIEQNGIEFIRFEAPDVNGISRGKMVALANFERAVEKGLAMVSDLLTWDPQADVAWLGTGYAEDITFSDGCEHGLVRLTGAEGDCLLESAGNQNIIAAIDSDIVPEILITSSACLGDPQ